MRGSSHAGWTLTEAARLLGEPQHRLIYLCEKGVVRPDVQEAEGRGSSRRFSARNLLEFGVALRLRALGIPAAVTGAVVHVLRGFEKAIRKELPGFRLPGSLVDARAPELIAVIGDDQRLYFTLAPRGSGPKTYGGVSLQDLLGSGDDAGAAGRGRDRQRTVGIQAEQGVLRARVELSVTGIAQDLRLEA